MSSNGRTLVSGTSNWGSSPCIRTMKYIKIIIYAGSLLILLTVSIFYFYPNQNTSITSKQISYKIVNQYPHSTNSYTQGLFFSQDILYESTGSPEYLPDTKSVLGILSLETGEIDVKVELDREIYFGEGSTVLGDKIYQLTYKNQKGFVYDATTFEKIREFEFVSQEGWGLTNDGVNLIMSDGTDQIIYLNPENFEIVKKISVQYQVQPQYNINELEYVAGFIYANIYQMNKIIKINPNNGDIVGILDLSLVVNQLLAEYPNIAELNGIAYRDSTDTFFITGKLWPYIYEMKLED
jgi:glutamine cyclotransferase